MVTTMAVRPHEEDWALTPDNAHPAARALLPEPIFWDSSDPYAPHGSDTGADILTGFSAARDADPDLDPLEFLEDELEAWGNDFGGSVTDPDELAELPEEDLRGMLEADDAAIALAFAMFILDGVVPAVVRDLALVASTRQALPLVARASFDEAGAVIRVDRVRRNAEKLAQMPTV